MKKGNTGGKNGAARGIFCLVLVLALALAVFALNGAAANPDPTLYDVKVLTCSTHSAALSKGELYLWGSNDSRQLPGVTDAYTAKPVKAFSGVADVAVATNRTLVVFDDGRLVFYGRDPITGEFAADNGTEVVSSGVKQVSAQEGQAAYISADGKLYAWGQGDAGQLGNGDTKNSSTPVEVMDDVSKVSVGYSYMVALKNDGTVWGWGSNSMFQLGISENGKPSAEPVSKPVRLMDNAADISVGVLHTCVLKSDGSLWTAGASESNQTGVNTSETCIPFTRVLTDVRSVSAGKSQTLAIGTDGVVYLWGTGYTGKSDSQIDTRIITPQATELSFVQVFAGDGTVFGVAPDGSISSWGENTFYRLGKEDGTPAPAPVKIFDKDLNWVYDPANENPGGMPSEKPLPEKVAASFMDGYDDGTFKPDRDVTRAQFLKMLITGLCSDFDKDKVYGSSTFSDVSPTSWYANYIAYAQQKDIANGYEDGTFHPDAPITRGEAAKLTVQVLELKGIDENVRVSASFDDANGWYAPFIDALAEKGILGGYGDRIFRPTKYITRAEAAKMIAVSLGFELKDEVINSMKETYANPFADVSDGKWYYGYLLYAAGYIE